MKWYEDTRFHLLIITMLLLISFGICLNRLNDARDEIKYLNETINNIQKVPDQTHIMQHWYESAYNSCLKELEDEIERCPELRILHPTKEELTMDPPIRVEHWIKGGMGELNSTVIYYNPNKVQHAFSDNRYYAIFTTNLSECDFP